MFYLQKIEKKRKRKTKNIEMEQCKDSDDQSFCPGRSVWKGIVIDTSDDAQSSSSLESSVEWNGPDIRLSLVGVM